MNSYIYKVKIQTETPFNISTGVKGDGFIKSPSVKDVSNKPYIPGSTLKGEMRANFRKIFGEELASKLFGDKNNPSRVIVDNFYLEDDNFQSNIRYGNAIDRYKHVAKDKALYSKEVITGTFVGEIKATINENEISKDDVYLAIKMITAIGGSKSRGLGRVKLEVVEVKK